MNDFLSLFRDLFGNLTVETVEGWFTYDPKHPILFNTGLFLGLFLVFYPLYIFSTRLRTFHFRNLYVFAFSLFFYYKSSGVYFVLLLFSGVVDYNLAKLLYEEALEGYRKFYLVLSVILNLCFLGYFKYAHFLGDTYNTLFDGHFSVGKIILPVGISFYTFQSMSYIIDIYRRELKPTNNILEYLFFVSFFPQLVAGPIVRASEFLPQIYKRLHLTKGELNTAFFLIIGGLIKKTVVSDYISINFVDRVFDSPRSYSAFENLMASYGYAIQIYCDFSGYSDMAIGIALLMGFHLSTNFRTPYQSASITEFWRRWHISLSTWLRDYLYISIGGNRRGTFGGFLFPVLFFGGLITWGVLYWEQDIWPLLISLAALVVFSISILLSHERTKALFTNANLMTTMLLGGLWHGASLRFIIWGALHGLALSVHKVWNEFAPLDKKGSFSIWRTIRTVIGVIVTFHFVAFCWIFFRANTFEQAFDIITHIATLDWNPTAWLTVVMGYRNVFIVMAAGYAWHFLPKPIGQLLRRSFDVMPVVLKAGVLALVFWLVTATASSGPQPFIYFQF
ncbi:MULTISPECIES: MBOAT family protein [unclassified Flavobacterium]|uniref:MBOAT family O-acyltransferase n=1 Tax=unclassified Flavobacterium TaxID=196869 RepID=UPI001F130C12|nr:MULTISPECIES: MBOAT family O-acyltransferase [unclassified Flavobacterium]UMY65617.1 MBOAT family protein [Flavobacterium sp. HJ-32-4]